MDSGAVVTPPYVGAAVPARAVPGPVLTPARVGDPASARAFARPYRDVAARLHQWEERGQLRRDDEPALYLHEYTAGGLTVRGLVGALDLSHRATGPEDRAVLPHEGIHPVQADELADRMTRAGAQPGPHPARAPGPAGVRDLCTRCWPAARRTTSSTGTTSGTGLGDPRPRAPRRDRRGAGAGPGRSSPTATTATRPTCACSSAHPGGPTDRGLAMLVDQDDTPLFLGAIHRVLTGVSLTTWPPRPRRSAPAVRGATERSASPRWARPRWP